MPLVHPGLFGRSDMAEWLALQQRAMAWLFFRALVWAIHGVLRLGGPDFRGDALRALERITFLYCPPSPPSLLREPDAADALAQLGYLAVMATERNTDEAILAVDLALGEFTTRWHPSLSDLWCGLGSLPRNLQPFARVGICVLVVSSATGKHRAACLDLRGAVTDANATIWPSLVVH